jgi:hypothetical protein
MPDIEIEQFRSEARSWLEANMEPMPRASHLGSSDSRTPEEIAASRILQRKLFDGGWAGISYPKEYGGRGLTAAHERAFREEALGYVMPDFGGAGHVMFGAIGRSLLAHASPAFLHRHIAKLLSGEELWCQFYSEHEAGSDLAGIRTSATRDGDRWLLSGSKIWSTGADHADYAMCLARTDWIAPKHQGLTWFAVPTNAKGLTIRPIVQINGAAGFCEEFLDDVEVTDDDIIGEVNRGWTVAQTMLVYERGAGSAGSVPVEPRRLAPDLVTLASKVGRDADPVARQLLARAHVNDYAQFHLPDVENFVAATTMYGLPVHGAFLEVPGRPETFVHPKGSGFGTLLQAIQFSDLEPDPSPPQGLPKSGPLSHHLSWVAVRVAHLQHAADFLVEATDASINLAESGARSVLLEWEGDRRLLLLDGSGGGVGVDHIAFHVQGAAPPSPRSALTESSDIEIVDTSGVRIIVCR